MFGRTLIFLSGFLFSVGAAAHHAAAGIYDRNDIGAIEGEIVSIFWRNPHVRLEIASEDAEGRPAIWEVEFGSVNTVERLGVERDRISIGDTVTVTGSRGREGRTVMFAALITMPDGEELILQAGEAERYGVTEQSLAAARSADAALRTDIFRVWVPHSRPNTGSGTTVYPLTAAGRQVQAAWDPAQDPALRCIPPGHPTAMDNPYPVEFVDEGDRILMRLEEWDGVRTFFMDPDNVGEPVQPRMGLSTGRLDGNTLTVRTTDIAWGYIDDLGTPMSEDVVIDEIFELVDDGTRLTWHATITDPLNFTEPVIMEGEWLWIEGTEMKPFNCALPE
ncbi:MAG TPA: DUF6152 family protein [Gammaproteobacteria bacterium]